MFTESELKAARQIIKTTKDSGRLSSKLRSEFDDRAGNIIWLLNHDHTLDLSEHPQLWILASGATSSYSAQDVINILIKTSQNQTILEECKSRRRNKFYSGNFVAQLSDGLELFVDNLPKFDPTIASEIRYELAAKGLQRAEDLDKGILGIKVQDLLSDYYDHKLEKMLAILPEEKVARALNMVASRPGYKLKEADFVTMSAKYATPEQIAHMAFNAERRSSVRTILEVMDQYPQDLAMHIRDIYPTKANQSLNRGIIAAIGWLIQYEAKNNGDVDRKMAQFFLKHTSPGYFLRYPETFDLLPKELCEAYILNDLSYCSDLLHHFCTEKVAKAMVEEVLNPSRYYSSFDPMGMAAIGKKHPDFLIEALEDKKNPQREVLVEALSASDDPQAIPTLIEFIGDTTEGVREAAQKGLKKQGSAAISSLLNALDSRKKNVRIIASHVLSKLPEKERSTPEIAEKAAARLKKEKVDEVIECLELLAGDQAEASATSKKTKSKSVELTIVDTTDAEYDIFSQHYAVWNNSRRRIWHEWKSEEDMGPYEVFADNMQKSLGDRATVVTFQRLAEKNDMIDMYYYLVNAIVARSEKNAVNAHLALVDWCRWWKEEENERDQPRLESLYEFFEEQIQLYLETYGEYFIQAMETALSNGKLPCLDKLWAHYVSLDSANKEDVFVAFSPIASAESLQLAFTNLPEVTLTQLISLLSSKKVGTRVNAATVLTQNPSTTALPALEAAFDKEKNAKAKVALANAVFAAASEQQQLAEQLTPRRPLTAAAHSKLDALLSRYAGTLPKKVTLETLPRLQWSSGKALSDGAMQWVMARLEQQGPKNQDSYLTALTAQWQPEQFQPLYEALRALYGTDKVTRLGWVLFAAEVFANDETFNEFGRNLDDEVRSGASTAAFYKVNMMARKGNTLTLTWLDHWTRKAKSQALKQRAIDALDDAAALRNISRDEIVDMLVVDLGFDAKGQQDFAFGDRTLTLTLQAEGILALSLNGKTLKNAPSTRKDDDADELKARRAELSAYRKQIKQIFTNAQDRLEQAMVTGRTFTQDLFNKTWGGNALLAFLARRVVWCLTTEDQPTYVRLDETNQFVDIDDEPVAWPEGALLSVLHPQKSGQDICAEWQEVFDDYEIDMPFLQLSRPVFTLPAEEAELRYITRYEKTSFPTPRLRTQMERRGWANGQPQDGGYVQWLYKYFAGADITVSVHVSNGFGVGFSDYEEDQEIHSIQFITGRFDRYLDYYDTDLLKLSEVNAIVYSETIADLESVLQR
ncbi:DUF4132 domain-containing protein [Vibrio sp. Of7-15]|uniref:DUF4132 domain-containing protein n=1 Tax=Vibrio sp. Of7-15 TaxID=2724879 RepID=UPI001EF32D86|nr:DUF4132 domain-containing protein [Vibrio sp. Of7-15]MCG7497472.1 DUF4132 domain-containing protein [Vibrio sp. Of7-15]